MIHNRAEKNERLVLLTASVLMLAIAFIQCFRTMHDLSWAYDTDFDRDMAFIRNSLEGHFGQDPTYQGNFLWYNPLLFSIEAMLVKITHLPINIIVTRAGIYLNLLGPLTFFLMAWRLFDLRIATASLLSYLFFAAGNIEGSGAATYSPWLYPVTFAQFFFYVNILLCFKAFKSGKYAWFVVLGTSIGLSFLCHTAPAILIILILVSMQAGNWVHALRQKNTAQAKRLILQGGVTFLPFLLVISPFLYYIIGKYHLHFINTYPAEWRPDEMYWKNWRMLIHLNFSLSLLIAVVGFAWFYRSCHSRLQRRIVLNWAAVCIIMYLYSTTIPGIRDKFHIQLPETVPGYHYFFYGKALQSLLYGFGVIFLFDKLFGLLSKSMPVSGKNPGWLAALVLIAAIAYFPYYRDRTDFSTRRELTLAKDNDTARIAAYLFLVDHVPSDKVILCPEKNSTFPVMASGRKMVCVSILFSNPYLDFHQRYSDACRMLDFLKTGKPTDARRLFDDYQVSYVFLPNSEITDATSGSNLFGEILMKNDGYTLFSLRR
jgi:hypothetical protein